MKLAARILIAAVTMALLCGHLSAQLPEPVGQFSSQADASLYTIFTNLGKKPNCYNYSDGWLVAGPDSDLGRIQYMAMSFTPKADAAVTELKLALFGSGPKPSAVISLSQDSNGLPGDPIHTWITHKLGNVGKGFCVLTEVKTKQGLPVQKGTQYWVVAEARGSIVDTWDFTYNNLTGNEAYDIGSGWQTQNSYLSAFAVLGTK